MSTARRAAPRSRFAARVYAVVRRIPAGRVATYGDVAALAGAPRAARAVGTFFEMSGSGHAVPSRGRCGGRLGGGAARSSSKRARLGTTGFVSISCGYRSLPTVRWTPQLDGSEPKPDPRRGGERADAEAGIFMAWQPSRPGIVQIDRRGECRRLRTGAALPAGRYGGVRRSLPAHAARLYSLLLRMVGGTQDAEDLLQDVFLQATESSTAFAAIPASEPGCIGSRSTSVSTSSVDVRARMSKRPTRSRMTVCRNRRLRRRRFRQRSAASISSARWRACRKGAGWPSSCTMSKGLRITRLPRSSGFRKGPRSLSYIKRG